MSQNYNRFVGLDIHKQNAVYAMVNRDGAVLANGTLPMADLQAWAKKTLTPEDQVLIEATGNAYYVYDLLSPLVGEVVIANPLAMHDRTRARRKTDKVDALALAKALASGWVATVWVPDSNTRQDRELCAHRHALSQQLSSLKSRLRSILYRHGVDFKGEDILDPKVTEFVNNSSLPEGTKFLFHSQFRIAKAIEVEIKSLEEEACRWALKNNDALKVMTLNGFRAQAAMIVCSAVGDISRFDSPKKLASYAGLVPSVYCSDQTIRYGRITKQGNSLLRWIMTEAANAAVLAPGPLRDRYHRLLRKGKEPNKAVIAVARHMLELVWHLLTKQQPFHYANPKSLTTKFQRILHTAHGRCPNGAAVDLANSVMGWTTCPATP